MELPAKIVNEDLRRFFMPKKYAEPEPVPEPVPEVPFLPITPAHPGQRYDVCPCALIPCIPQPHACSMQAALPMSNLHVKWGTEHCIPGLLIKN